MQNRHRKLVEEAEAVEEGHFVFVSGVHSRWYMNKTRAFADPAHSLFHVRAVLEHFNSSGIEAVVAPELGAIPFMADIGMMFYLDRGWRVMRVMATKVPGTKPPIFTIGRSQEDFLRGKRVLVVEDVFTKGGSAKSTVDAARALEADVIGVTGLWNRGNRASAKMFGVPDFFPLIDEYLPDVPPEECEQCLSREPISVHLGKGGEFLLTERARELGLKAAA